MSSEQKNKLAKGSRVSSSLFRLTLWHVAVLTLFTVGLSSAIYILLDRDYFGRSDSVLTSMEEATIAILQHGLSESGLDELAARDAVRILSFPGYTLCIYDSYGNLLAEKPVGASASLRLPNSPVDRDGEVHLYTLPSLEKPRTQVRAALVYSTIRPVGRTYIVVASRSIAPIPSQVLNGRYFLFGGVPIGLLLAGLAGWFLVKKTFAPVLSMSDHAIRISAKDLNQRFEVFDSKDELNQLARTFNDLLTRLSDSFETQARFMADASHELRTPLSIICSAASVTLELQEPHHIGDYRDALEVVRSEGSRLSRVVEDMFLLARVDSKGIVMQYANFSLDDLLLELVRSFGRLASEKRVHLEVSRLDDAPLYGDPDLIRRIIANLLANAIRHTPADGSISLSLLVEESCYRIYVADTGNGIAAEHAERIFQRFYRVYSEVGDGGSDNPSSATSGAGLGLAIARVLTEMHGGTLTLESSSRLGSVFVCMLPAVLAMERPLT